MACLLLTIKIKQEEGEMKLGRPIVMLSVIVILLFTSPYAYGVNLKLGTVLDDISFEDVNGKDLDIAEFRGKVIMLTFWSTWASRCLEELTFLNRQFGNLDDLVIIAVNQDSDKEVNTTAVEQFVNGIGETAFKVVYDRGYVLWDRFEINALPTSIIIDREGKVIHIEPNFYFDSPDNFRRVIGELLVEKKI